jgi:myo-inositol 2-dehydrogenase/D-chiro-inositol 1-dehydrogenase
VLGEYASEVYVASHAHSKSIAALGDVDTVAITLKFPSNVIATIDLSRLAAYGHHQTLEVRIEGNIIRYKAPP